MPHSLKKVNRIPRSASQDWLSGGEVTWFDERREIDEVEQMLREFDEADKPRYDDAWGTDDEFIGGEMSYDKPKNQTRLMFQAKHGYNLRKKGGQLKRDLNKARRMLVDYLGISEPSLDTTKPSVLGKIRDAARNCEFDHCQVTCGSSPITAQYDYKPGGTLSVVADNLTGRMLSTEVDYLGRWIINKFGTSDGRVVTIIVTYQISDKRYTDVGQESYVTQQAAVFRSEGRQYEKPKKNHTKDLMEVIKKCQANNEWIIMGGDFNEVLGDDENGLTKIVQVCKLTDVVHHMHGQQPNFRTYDKGSKVIDYVLVSEEVLDCVVEAGYLPFQFRMESDHRGIFVDVDTAMLFGSLIANLSPLLARDISSKKPHQIAQYFQLLDKYLEDQNFWNNLKRLDTDPCEQLAERLDRVLTAGCLYAAKRVKRYPSVPYSPEIVQLRAKFEIYKMYLLEMTNHTRYSKALANKRLKLGKDAPVRPQTISECKKLKEKSRVELRKAEWEELKTAKLRVAHQIELIATLEADGDKKTAKIIKRIKRAEAVSRVFKKIAFARGKTMTGGLTQLLVPENPEENPKTCKRWRLVQDPEEIKRLLQDRNKRHFGQAQGTPFTMNPLAQGLDFTGTSAMADKILDGWDVRDPRIDKMTRIFIKNLRKDDLAEILMAEITEAEYDNKMKKWPERTTTSPSGVDLGHYKSVYAHHTLKKGTTEAVQLEALRQDIKDARRKLLNFGLFNGYAYTRWQKVINTMILKEKNNYKIHKLRVIHIYEADYNMFLALMWRKLVKLAEGNGTLPESQYGGAPGKDAHTPVFIEEMEHEISRLSRKPLIKVDYDAASCYDRIIMFLAMLVSRAKGMPTSVCKVNGMNLEQAKYYLRTKLGVSDDYVVHTLEEPWYGSGQGSGNSPTLWLFISGKLIDSYSEVANGAIYTSPDGKQEIKMLMTKFVDDANGRTNSWHSEQEPTVAELIRKAQHDAQCWSNLLWSSGGLLELMKCCYYIIKFTFERSGKPVMCTEKRSEAQQHPEIQMQNGEKVKIQHHANDEAHKTLGYQKAPLGDQLKQQRVLKEKCDEFAKVLSSTSLNREECSRMYHAIYCLSVTYVLAVSFFSFDLLDAIQRKAHRSFVANMGYCRNTHRAILFGPKFLGGCSFFHLYDKQSLFQLQLFLKFWRSPGTEAGRLLRIAVSWAQLYAGVSYGIFENTAVPLPHLQCKWLLSVRAYLSTIMATLDLDETYVPETQRENDSYIMDHVLRAGLGDAEIERINYCRLYLQVVTVSDIATADGTRIENSMFWGERDHARLKTKWVKINQECPVDPTSWTAWRNALKRFSDNKQLNQPLGNWTRKPSELRMDWNFFLDKETQTLYRKHATGIEKYTGNRNKFRWTTMGLADRIPESCVPVEVKEANNTWYVKNRCHLKLENEPEDPRSFEEFLSRQEKWESKLFDSVEMPMGADAVAEFLANNEGLIVSDGCVKDKQSCFGWLLVDHNREVLVRCSGPVYGYKISSYRAEAYGVLSSLRFLIRLKEYYGMETIKVHRQFCDNEGVIKSVRKMRKYKGYYPNDTLDADWDVLQAIKEAMAHFNDHFSVSWVKGHQDDHKKFEDLSLEAQVNVMADELAEDYRLCHPDEDLSHVPRIGANKAQLNLPWGTVTNKLKLELRLARTEETLVAKICEDNNWTRETFDKVDWTVHGRAINRFDNKFTTLVKMLHGILPVGRRVHKYDPIYLKSCPTCHCEEEVPAHLPICPHESREAWRQKLKSNFKKKLEKAHTEPPLIQIATDGLQAFLDNTDLAMQPYDPTYHDLVEEQNEIGWDNFMKGRWSKHWTQMQDDYLSDTKLKTNKNNGTAWATNMVSTLWTDWFQLWTMRNEDRHGKDKTAQAQAKREQVIREVSFLYQMSGDVQRKDMDVFDTDLETMIQSSTANMFAWKSNWEKIITASVQRERASREHQHSAD